MQDLLKSVFEKRKVESRYPSVEGVSVGICDKGQVFGFSKDRLGYDDIFGYATRAILERKRAASEYYFQSITPISEMEFSDESISQIADRWKEVSAREVELGRRVEFLEAQLMNDRSYAQLYRLGAGSLLVAGVSLLFWTFTGIGAPFHQVFAAAVIPASIGVMAMAFLIRRTPKNEPSRV